MANEQDITFLHEYVDFAADGPVKVAETLHAGLLDAHHKEDFATVAHLQVSLHAQMVACMETAGALLLAYSQWDNPDGILGKLLSYRVGNVPEFIERLNNTSDVLQLLCFPNKENILGHCDDRLLVEQAYTNDELKKYVMEIVQMYLSEDIRKTYNKIKHAGLYIRHPDLLAPKPDAIIRSENVYVMGLEKDGLASFPVTGDKGLSMADTFLNNIRVITQRSKELAGFVVYFLENDLLTASMRKSNPNDDSARRMVKEFCNYVVKLRAIHHIGRELFEDDEARALMEQTAKQFFLDINRILISHFLLEVAKITDPPKSKGHENFTVATILQSIDWPKNVYDDLRRLNNLVNTFRKYIVVARHKVLAHYDKETSLSWTVLGEFPEREDEKLMDALEEMANILHEACFGSIFGSITVTMPGDVLDLKSALRRAVAFKKLFAESKGEETIRLAKYLDCL